MIPYEQMFIYHLHVRGFTKGNNAGVAHPGTFEGVVEKLDYIRDLGFNCVELAPCYEFSDELPPLRSGSFSAASARSDISSFMKKEEKRTNYWGFAGESFYFSPKSSYSAGDDPEASFRSLMDAVHSRQMELMMEVFFPEGINPVVTQDCLRYYAEEFHVDGFHLRGAGVWKELIAADPYLSGKKLIFEYVTPEMFRFENGDERRIAFLSTDFTRVTRRLLKSDFDQTGSWLYQFRNNPKDCGVVNAIATEQGFTLADLVSYNEKHNEENGEGNRDGETENYSWNCGEEGPTRKKTIRALRLRQRKNAILLTFLSQGTPFLLAGDEMGHSKKGNNNTYCQDNALSWLNWRQVSSADSLCGFVKEVIAFRKSHPLLQKKVPYTDMDLLSCGYPEFSVHSSGAWSMEADPASRKMGILLCGAESGKPQKGGLVKPDTFIFYGINMHWESGRFSLPNLPGGFQWSVRLSTSDEKKEILPDKNGRSVAFEIPGRTITILEGIRK